MRGLLLAIAVALPSAASAGIFDAAEPNVAAGNHALSKGDAAAALGHYEKAIEAHPDSGEAWYDKGLALDALGRHEEAAEAFTQALARRRDSALGAKDYTNLGNALAAMNRVDDAMRSYRSALEIDPDDEVARQNLEVMLRRKQQQEDPPKSQQQQDPKDGQEKDPSKDREQDSSQQQARNEDGQQEDSSQQQAGNDEQQQKDPSQQQAGNDDRQQKDSSQQEQDQQQDAGASDDEKGDRQDAGAAAQADGNEQPENEGQAMPLRKSDTQRILDSLRGNEKSFQLWRGQEKGRRSDAEKDW